MRSALGQSKRRSNSFINWLGLTIRP
jgi:hypothetical protein